MIRSLMHVKKKYYIFQTTKHFSLRQNASLQEVVYDLQKSEQFLKRDRSSEKFKSYLLDCFRKTEDLPDYAFCLIKNACSRGSGSFDLIFNIVSTLNHYSEHKRIDNHFSLAQKTDILYSVLKYKELNLLQLVCFTFKIYEQSHNFKSFIEDLIQNQKFVEACYCIAALKLHDEFSFEKVLMPLLLEGQVKPAIVYLTDKPDLQIKAATELDKLLILKRNNLSHFAQSRKAFRMLTHLINTFNIPLDYCQTLLFIRSKSAINVLVHRRKEQSVTEETWEEMVMNVIGDNEDLKRFLVQKLLNEKDTATALKMAERFNIKDIDMTELGHRDMVLESSEQPTLEDSTEDGVLETPSEENLQNDHLEFALCLEDIKVVATKEEFLSCLSDICENYSMLGIDSEWKPRFGLSSERLSLIQIGLSDKVYILDMLKLNDCLEEDDWDKLMDDIFSNPKIIKLGCGIMCDIKMILESVKCSKGKAMIFSHILDIAVFYQKMKNVYPEKINNTEDISNKGLSYLCETILGKPLNKEERLCDWEKRPLTESQLKYAALDAHCLLQMYSSLKDFSLRERMNFDHLANVAIVLTTSQWKPKKKYKGKRKPNSVHISLPLPVESLKLVMDHSLQNLGRQLRQLGADVVILEPNFSLDDVVQVYQTEKRVIVCTEDLLTQMEDKINERFYHVVSDDVTVSHLLHHFNAHVSPRSIYSRCVACNSKNGIKIESKDLIPLKEFFQIHGTISQSELNEDSLQLSPELQGVVADILSSGIDIISLSNFNLSPETNSAFLCKKCGHIS